VRLLIDLGNSRLKWAWYDRDRWQSGAADVGSASFDNLLGALNASGDIPEQIAVASVADQGRMTALKKALTARWSAPVLEIRSVPAQLGVSNRYRDPAQLGADRWAALIAARQETTKPVCVISCGTAVTIDAMNEDGEFVGGVILPGLDLMRRSLAEGTAAIAMREGDDSSCQALSTEDAVMSGTRFALAGAVTRIAAEHRRVVGTDMSSLITGGSAGVILPLLDFPVIHKPDLVLFGIRAISEAGQ
jgi:type III pantothenate kinase